MIITVDGVAGVGKSSICKLVAEKSSFLFISSGALYRLYAYFFTKGIEFGEGIEKICFLKNGEIISDFFLNINEEIRDLNVSKLCSEMAMDITVRNTINSFLRLKAKKNNLIVDGRDMGFIFDNYALLKVFLTASLEHRVSQWEKGALKRGENVAQKLDAVYEDLKNRDYKDTNRKISPLKISNGAIVFDMEKHTICEVSDYILSIIKSEEGKQ